MRLLLLFLFFINGLSYASPVEYRDNAMRSIQAFNPQKFIPKYTESPKEINIKQESIAQEANNRISRDDTVKLIIAEEKRRTKSIPNSQSSEITNSDAIIENTKSCPDEDISASEASDDINEGISRLGTISETAEEVAKYQVNSQQPLIFKGYYQECKKYMLGLRDCCTNEGFFSGIINCPIELQNLQRAKEERRAVYIGHYKPRRISTTRYGYCVFPTKLAGIVQTQGREAQLRVGFGSAKRPDCRGLTPEEIERINFAALDINGLVQGLTSKKNVPDSSLIDAVNYAHVNSMHNKGRAYD
ncbi:MAG: conjugal transfer protein TraN [Legionellaceae bacterium]|nr:conjugal transfer protein TraN [Legionellaceae bacterium]